MHDYTKRFLLITIIFCAALITPAFWFPSWHMYIVVASILCLTALPVLSTLFILIWILTRFMTKGEN